MCSYVNVGCTVRQLVQRIQCSKPNIRGLSGWVGVCARLGGLPAASLAADDYDLVAAHGLHHLGLHLEPRKCFAADLVDLVARDRVLKLYLSRDKHFPLKYDTSTTRKYQFTFDLRGTSNSAVKLTTVKRTPVLHAGSRFRCDCIAPKAFCDRLWSHLGCQPHG